MLNCVVKALRLLYCLEELALEKKVTGRAHVD